MRSLILPLLMACTSDIGVITKENVIYEEVTVVEETIGDVAYETGITIEQNLDILFVIDSSGSMREEHNELMAYFPDLYTSLESTVFDELDWRVGVRSADPEQEFVGMVDSTDPNALFSMIALITQVGTRGFNEMGLSTAIVSMSNDTGFHRPNAHLMIVYISDEPDQSSIQPAAFLSLADSFKQPPYQTIHTAVVYLPEDAEDTTQCERPSSIQVGTGYIDIADEMVSLCNPSTWGAMLNDAVELMPLYNAVWPLNHTPYSHDEITVLVDSVEVSEWSYDAAANAVVFDEAPPPGVSVTIIYLIQ